MRNQRNYIAGFLISFIFSVVVSTLSYAAQPFDMKSSDSHLALKACHPNPGCGSDLLCDDDDDDQQNNFSLTLYDSPHACITNPFINRFGGASLFSGEQVLHSSTLPVFLRTESLRI